MSDRQARLAAVLDLWIVLRWFYPYLEDQHIDLDSTLGPALQEAATASTSDTQRHALSRLTLALHDDHARVLRPGIDDGLLPVLFRSLEERIIVTATLLPGHNITIGSSLVSIDGIPASEARLRSAELMSAATEAFALRHSTYGIAFGKKGTIATLILREPGSARDVVYMVPRLDRGELVAKLREDRPASGTVLAERVVYVDLHTLDEGTWVRLLPTLLDAKAIIFDLRGYIGTAAFSPLEYLADHELRSPTFVHPLITATHMQRYEDHMWYVAPRRQRLRAKAIFLADARTASAPETILQIVKGEHLGLIVGEPTGGTNGNIAEYDLIGEMSMRFTAMRVLNHDGSVFQGRGITPDMLVHPTINGIIARRDEILEAAVDLAKQ
jgi:C-terminal processing protease CtpA/Prc